MLVVSFRSVNYEFWYRLWGVHDRTLIFLAIEVLFRVAHHEIKKKTLSYCVGSLITEDPDCNLIKAVTILECNLVPRASPF